MRHEKVTVKIMKRSVICAACFLSVRLNEIPNLQLRLLNVALTASVGLNHIPNLQLRLLNVVLTVQRVYRLFD